MFPFKSDAIADKRITNSLRSEEKKGRTYFKSDWTCFKADNRMSVHLTPNFFSCNLELFALFHTSHKIISFS